MTRTRQSALYIIGYVLCMCILTDVLLLRPMLKRYYDDSDIIRSDSRFNKENGDNVNVLEVDSALNTLRRDTYNAIREPVFILLWLLIGASAIIATKCYAMEERIQQLEAQLQKTDETAA